MSSVYAYNFGEVEDDDDDVDYQPSSSHVETELQEDGEEGGEDEDDESSGSAAENARQPAYLLDGDPGMRVGSLILASGSGGNYGGGRRGRGLGAGRGEGVDPVPNPDGQRLMASGEFGSNNFTKRPELGSGSLKGMSPGNTQPAFRRRPESNVNLCKLLLQRELGVYTGARARNLNQLMAQSMLPSTDADFIIRHGSRSYSGQFSEDGNLFYSCSQDFQVRLYDTSNPYQWKYYKSVDYVGGRWTITDATLSPDNCRLAYSSIASRVCLASTARGDAETHHLEFSSGRGHNRNAMDPRYGIWSIRFSGDGREIVAGASDSCLYVYDIETRTPVLKLEGHMEDVNAVCYGDRASPHIICSGSDDTTIKVWDRRSMADGREVGVFVGHTEGLTYVDSKGDGRYLLSNAKDQTMKLWDIRKLMDRDIFDSMGLSSNCGTGFDYRHDYYAEQPTKHPHDCSLVTFRGHSVLKTLIRCHFSPPTSTGSRYVYTGSADGKVRIYNVDATEVATIDVHAATASIRSINSRLLSNVYSRWVDGPGAWRTCVRDVSWHPNAPVIATTSWNGFGLETGTVTLHSWRGSGEKPCIYDSKLKGNDFKPDMAEL